MLLSALLSAVVAVSPQQAPPSRPSLTITRAATPPRLEDFHSGERRDGVAADAFLQREPNDLVPSSERTETYISYDSANLYVVFVCHAKDPSKVRARMNRREAMLDDDFVGVFLDTFNDHQRAYMFAVSPLGIQLDGIITEGQEDDFSFDTIWQARGEGTDFGYVALISIPFKSLRFPPASGPRTWGIAFMRGIPVNSENAFWPGITRRKTSFTGQFADLHGLENVSPGRNIQLIPYGTFTGARFLDRDVPAYDTAADGRAGIDAKVVAHDSMAIDFTLNPDFSQVESDEPQITVNQRFEVFFPEKRPFFLENSDYFKTPIDLLFTRRIGDPQFGARLTGKVGDYSLGFLSSDDRGPGKSVPENSPFSGDRSTFNIARVSRDIMGQSSVGAIYTDWELPGSNEFNRVGGVDTRLKFTPNWTGTFQGVVSSTQNFDGSYQAGPAYKADTTYDSTHLNFEGTYNDVSPGFLTQAGFVNRTDIREFRETLNYRFRPKSGPLLSWGPDIFTDHVWAHDGTRLDTFYDPDIAVQLKGQTYINYTP